MAEPDPLINREKAIERLAGDDELYRELVAMAVVDLPEHGAALRAALAASDREVIGRQAHAIKSLAATLGAESLEHEAMSLEDRARRRDEVLDEAAVMRIQQLIPAVIRQLTA